MSTLRLTPALLHHHPRRRRRLPAVAGGGGAARRIASAPAAVCVPSFSAPRRRWCPVKALSGLADAAISEVAGEELLFEEKFLLKRLQAIEGKVSVRLCPGKDDKNQQLTVGCNLPGKWILHWGVTYADDVGREWDQPPPEMRPPETVPIKDYAVETPMKLSSPTSEGDLLCTLQIDISMDSSIAAIHFVLKDEETGSWYQHRGRDFKVPLMQQCEEEDTEVSGKKGFSIWPGAFDHLSNILLNVEGSQMNDDDEISRTKNSKKQMLSAKDVYEEYTIVKEEFVQNVLTVSVRNSPEPHKVLVHFNTDLPGDVTIHWGVSGQNDRKEWVIPPSPHPPGTKSFRKKALQTTLQEQGNGGGSSGLFSLDKRLAGLLFVLKLNEYTWLNNMGSDFFIPLSDTCDEKFEKQGIEEDSSKDSVGIFTQTTESGQSGNQVTYTEGIISGIRNLVSDLSSGKKSTLKDKNYPEKVLQEIEKLAAEAYSIFRGSTPTFVAETDVVVETLKPPVKICSGTGSGYEILCQGFNWESHKSRRWYMELNDKVSKLSSLGFTVIWLPPPTESVSPEGYMPRDLYNLNSRYGTIEELKILVKKLHDVDIKVLGDVVLNHRCAHYQNQNGVWNIFGGRLNWDDRAVVSDDPHFQGRGNRGSGDNFHAAPNIDHSQDFVRKDIKEWLGWLREEIGYDGWRLDFVRGFWGGYVKDYLDATEPYFAVGEYWDSLSYTYGNLDPNQDAHRQRIIDWINATNGTAGAFDVTTKGMLHAALEKCEYWRLSDDKGQPPGVVGWWPSRAVTFIENHDTGSTQGHWRFPSGKEMQGYAYILTHPGTPAVFYDHIFSGYESEISQLLSLRHRSKLHCRSTVQIVKAERDVYGAIIDEKIAMKIGPGHYEPPSGPQKWSIAAEGRDYKVWESS